MPLALQTILQGKTESNKSISWVSLFDKNWENQEKSKISKDARVRLHRVILQFKTQAR